MDTTADIQQALGERYEVTGVIGRGGFGIVFEAIQVHTRQRVAIKVLRTDRFDKDELETEAKRFQREARLIARLNHPHIVRLLDSGTLPSGELYMALEFVDGTPLNLLIKRRRLLKPRATVRVMGQVLDALACAHAAGVIHRDLKPHNIMITETGARRNAVVLDFGIATVEQAHRSDDFLTLTASGSIRGTPSYMAPEQLRASGATPRSDIYAWGLVLIEALTGAKAVSAGTMPETMALQLSNEPIPVPPVLDELGVGGVLRRALAKDQEERFQTAEEALAALDGVDLAPGVDPVLGVPAGVPVNDTVESHLSPDDETPPPTDDNPAVTGRVAGSAAAGLPMPPGSSPAPPTSADPPSEDQRVVETTAWRSDPDPPPVVAAPARTPSSALPRMAVLIAIVAVLIVGVAVWIMTSEDAPGPQHDDRGPAIAETTADLPTSASSEDPGTDSGTASPTPPDDEPTTTPTEPSAAGSDAPAPADDDPQSDGTTDATPSGDETEADEPSPETGDDAESRRADEDAAADRDARRRRKREARKAEAAKLADDARKLVVSNPSKAASIYAEAVDLDGRNGSLRASYGVALERAGRECAALKQFERALRYGVSGRTKSLAKSKRDALSPKCD